MRPIIEIVRERLGKRHKITSAEAESLLRGIHRECGRDSLANSYLPRSCDAESGRPWLAWLSILRGITVISFGQNLRDGWMRYDQPGFMAPTQHSALTLTREGGVSPSTLQYLRGYCGRLLVVANDEQEVFLPPGLQMRLAEIGRRRPYRLPSADAAAVEMLWEERNNCPEAQVSNVDDRMLRLIAGDAIVPRGSAWNATGDTAGRVWRAMYRSPSAPSAVNIGCDN